MPVIDDPMRVPPRTGTIYPEPFKNAVDGRIKRALTERLGLTQFGVNLTTLEPGGQSSLRHWHENEDEFVYVLAGELTLVTMDGARTLRVSQAAGFPKGDRNGHCLINRSDQPATYLQIGTRAKDDTADYPDVDLRAEKRDGKWRFVHKDGTPYA